MCKGELIFSSVQWSTLTRIYGHWLCFSSNMHYILSQHMFRVRSNLHVPDFSKSTSKYLLFTKAVQLESMDLGALQQCIIFGCNVFFYYNYSELFNNVIFSKLTLQMYFWHFIFFCQSFFFLNYILGVFIKNNASKIGSSGLKSTRIKKNKSF